MDKRWLCAGLSVLCFLFSAKMGWFRGLILPMTGVGFIFAGMWIWFAERMALTSNQQPLYMPTPTELAAIKQAALAKQGAVAPVVATPSPSELMEIVQTRVDPATLQSQPVPPSIAPPPTGRAVFDLGTEAPIIRVKPPQT
jgi:hypothetical protein